MLDLRLLPNAVRYVGARTREGGGGEERGDGRVGGREAQRSMDTFQKRRKDQTQRETQSELRLCWADAPTHPRTHAPTHPLTRVCGGYCTETEGKKEEGGREGGRGEREREKDRGREERTEKEYPETHAHTDTYEPGMITKSRRSRFLMGKDTIVGFFSTSNCVLVLKRLMVMIR